MYRIFTEDLNRAEVQKLVDSTFPAYTLFPAQGCYKGQHENSIVIEITSDDATSIRDLAKSIKALNHQEAVLVTYQPQTSELV